MRNIILPFLLSIILVSLVFVFFEDVETYFHNLLQTLQSNTLRYTIFSFLILSSDILLPVPSSIVMYSNGVVLGVLYGFALSMISSILSSIIGYGLGRFTNFRMKQGAADSHKLIQRYGNVAIIISRGIPILSESVSFTAGYNLVKFRSYFLLNLVGYFPVCMIYSYFGHMGQDTNMFFLSFVLSILISALIWFFGKSLIAPLDETSAG